MLKKWPALFLASTFAFALMVNAAPSTPVSEANSPSSATPCLEAFFHPTVEIPERGAPFLRISEHTTLSARIVNRISQMLSPLLAYSHLREPVERLRAQLNPQALDETGYYAILAQAIGMDVRTYGSLYSIPTSGPLMMVSNHPLNGAEAIAMAGALSPLRKDIRVVMTDALRKVPGMADHAFMLQVHGSDKDSVEAKRERTRANVKTLRDIRQHLKNGGGVIIFPAGEVSSKTHIEQARAYDRPWNSSFHNIYLKELNTTIVPVFVEGQPSQLSLWLKIHVAEAASAALHVSNLVNAARAPIHLHFGQPYPPRILADLSEDDFIKLLRAHVYGLAPVR